MFKAHEIVSNKKIIQNYLYKNRAGPAPNVVNGFFISPKLEINLKENKNKIILDKTWQEVYQSLSSDIIECTAYFCSINNIKKIDSYADFNMAFNLYTYFLSIYLKRFKNIDMKYNWKFLKDYIKTEYIDKMYDDLDILLGKKGLTKITANEILTQVNDNNLASFQNVLDIFNNIERYYQNETEVMKKITANKWINLKEEVINFRQRNILSNDIGFVWEKICLEFKNMYPKYINKKDNNYLLIEVDKILKKHKHKLKSPDFIYLDEGNTIVGLDAKFNLTLGNEEQISRETTIKVLNAMGVNIFDLN